MTHERVAIETLCRISPGRRPFAKRFIKWLATLKEDHILSPRQRRTVWQLILKYHRQIKPISPGQVAYAESWLAMDPSWRAFSDTLDGDPRDWGTRLVYSDFLLESGRDQEAAAQRYMVEHEWAPELRAAGMAFGARGDTGINFEWHFYPYHTMGSRLGEPVARAFIGNAWWRDRVSAERFLVKALSPEAITAVSLEIE